MIRPDADVCLRLNRNDVIATVSTSSVPSRCKASLQHLLLAPVTFVLFAVLLVALLAHHCIDVIDRYIADPKLDTRHFARRLLWLQWGVLAFASFVLVYNVFFAWYSGAFERAVR